MENLNFRRRADVKGFVPLIFACVLFLAEIFIYRAYGKNEFAPTLSGKALGGWIAAVVICGILIIWKNKALTYGAYLCGLYAWLEFLTSQINYIANVFVAIDGSRFSISFIVLVLVGLAAWAMALVSAMRNPSVFSKEIKKQEKGSEEA
ncbi:MAG: hypothetical protein PHE06_02915 [Lachnospiraceae bacterium]|nr:hypothetical protein [Lachnospiraceae bacterium]MDD3794919.1 hypothetical protein [Lachnospiraceae bacterium]